MNIVERPIWSLGTRREVYECDVSGKDLDPLERVAEFYARRHARNWDRDSGKIQFSRGSVWATLFGINELKKRHTAVIRINEGDSGRKLHCEFRFPGVLTLAFPPHRVQEEVSELEAFLNARNALDSYPGGLQRGRKRAGFALYLPLRFLYRCYRIVSWLRYWEARRFTRAGQTLVICACVAAMLGFDPENTVGYQGFTLLLAMLLVSVLFRVGFKPAFEAERLLPRFGTVGQPFTYRVAVRNLTRKKQVGLTLLENLADVRPNFEQWRQIQIDDHKYIRPFRPGQRRRGNPFRLAKLKDAPLAAMLPQQTEEAEVELTPLRRGTVRFNGLTVARPDPLGLFRALHDIPLPSSVLILPRRYPLPHLAMPGNLKYHQGGVAMASNVGQSDEFVSLREYRRGDPLRHIHWRSWAKAGKPIVKEFEDEFFVRHALILDTFTDRPYSEEFEEAVSVAASFACTVLTQESLLDLLFVERQAYCFTTGRGLAHADQMLEILASVQPCQGSFATLDDLVVNHASVVSGCVFVLLDWDAPRQRLVQKMRTLGLSVLVLVIRPAGKAGPLPPGPMRDDPERLVSLEVGKVQQQLAGIT